MGKGAPARGKSFFFFFEKKRKGGGEEVGIGIAIKHISSKR